MSREPSLRPILPAAGSDPAGRAGVEGGDIPPGLPCESSESGAACAHLSGVCGSERRLRRAMWASGSSVWEWRAEDGRICVDPFLLGSAEVNLPACTVEVFLQRLHPEDAQAAHEAWCAHREGHRADLEVVLRLHHEGRQRWLRLRGRAIERDAQGRPQHVMGMLEDMTAEREAADALQAMARALERMSRHDGLTDLPNRAGLEDYLAQRMAQGGGFALMQLDIDGVKDINDSYGHEAGDRLLRTAAARLREVLPGIEAGGVLARWSGSSFSIVLEPGSAETEVRSIAQGVIAAFAPPFDVEGHPVSLQARIGAVLAPRDGATPVELLRKVDVATQAARGPLRHGLAFYGPDLEDDVQRRVRLFSLLRADAERNGFAFVAQPKVDRDGRATGAELLMRWPTEAFGPISPAEFIPMAEKLGLIGLMGRHALHAAARLAARCAAAGQRLPVAVNLSPRQLLQPGLDRQLLVACERAGIEPALLEVELTESALLAGLDVVRPVLERLRGLGFALALDDFGTGYSSLSYLRQLPLSKVKIDRSFLLDIERDERALRMLEPMIRLCEVLGLSTVAEGVETPAQFELLRRLGVPEFQGYHFARPLPVDDWASCVEAAGAKSIQLPLPLPRPV